MTLTLSAGTLPSSLSAILADSAMSVSVRSRVSFTSISFAIAVTPATRFAIFSARHLSLYVGTCPIRVTTPFFTATAMFRASMLGSHSSSRSTSRRNSDSVFVLPSFG
jgi:hypothetical protein